MAFMLALALPGFAHEGHEHGAIVKPASVRLAPRFETRSEDLEIVGVLAGKDLVLYVDGAADNAPIQGAQIEVGGQGINGVATEMAGGVYQLLTAASLIRPGKYALTISVQAGEIVDLLAADLEVEEAAVAATTDGHALRVWWIIGGIALVLLSGGLIVWRLRHQAK